MLTSDHINPLATDRTDLALAKEFGGIFTELLSNKASLAVRTPDGRFADNSLLEAHLGIDEDCLDCGRFTNSFVQIEQVTYMETDFDDDEDEELTPNKDELFVCQGYKSPEQIASEEYWAAVRGINENAIRARAAHAKRLRQDATARAEGRLTKAQRRRRNRTARKTAAALLV